MPEDFFSETVINAKLDELILKHIYILIIDIENSLADYQEKQLKNIAPNTIQIRVKLRFLFNHIKPYLSNDLLEEDFYILESLVNSAKFDDLSEALDKLNLWFFNKKSRVIL